MSKVLEEMEEEIAKCMKCGLCRAVCPIFTELDNEAAVARGKINLMKNVMQGDLELSDKYEKLMELCLLCKACVDNCPCGVEVDKLVCKAREELANEKGLSAIKKGIFSLVNNQTLFPIAMKLGANFQGLAFSNNDGPQPGNSIRVGIGLDKQRVVPKLEGKQFRDRHPEVIKVKNPQSRVAFFTGCAINYMAADFGESVVNVLVENNIEVVIPKEQNCCGVAINSYGDTNTANALAKHNLEVFSEYDVDAIVTACSSCGSTLREEYEEWIDTDFFKRKVYDISEYLVDVIDYDTDNLGQVRKKVTYHDPCHLVRGMRVTEQPRQILKDIPELYFEEMEKPDRCCGAAGTFNLKHYDLSFAINRHKTDDIKQTDTDVVATGCAGCRMHIADGLNRANEDHDVVHTVQLLDEAYQKRKTVDS
jgi:glycolate oxidase iron-sulfur subunit